LNSVKILIINVKNNSLSNLYQKAATKISHIQKKLLELDNSVFFIWKTVSLFGEWRFTKFQFKISNSNFLDE